MPARRRHYPGRGPATGTAGMRAAYGSCARPGCGHARIRHTADGLCAGLVMIPSYDHPGSPDLTLHACPCPGFAESEE